MGNGINPHTLNNDGKMKMHTHAPQTQSYGKGEQERTELRLTQANIVCVVRYNFTTAAHYFDEQ